mmetsp:Transcript_30918/g.58716  ORF Transcript_30918/g.58716 Transcript_30918/m.58716 type:complete len:222 (-) Transcript_30918:30-695(-)
MIKRRNRTTIQRATRRSHRVNTNYYQRQQQHQQLRQRQLRLLLLPALILAPYSYYAVLAQDSNHYFCGASWDDASQNCDERQQCVGGTDDECESTEARICFGGTTCDSRVGHGSKFKFANVPHGDISNTRFCGVDWASAIDDCSISTHCPTGFSEECPGVQSCYGGLQCNVQDLLAEAEEAKANDDANANVAIHRIPKRDARRNNFCGTNWGDANSKCDMW